MLTFRFAVVHSLPSANRVEETIVPDSFWSLTEPCVDPAPPTDPNAILSAIAVALIRLVVMLSSPLAVIAERCLRTFDIAAPNGGKPIRAATTMVADFVDKQRVAREFEGRSDAVAGRRRRQIRPTVGPWIAMRRTAHGSGLDRWRWVVERTFAWFNQFRRLCVHYDKRAEIHEPFLALGCALIAGNRCGRRGEPPEADALFLLRQSIAVGSREFA